MRARASRPLAVLALCAALLALPRTAEAQTPPGAIEGNLVAEGVSLVLWGGGTPSELVAAAETQGCSAASVWITVGGGFRGYAPSSPDFANESFLSRYPGGVMPEGPVLVVCRTVTATPSPSSGDRAIEGTSCTLFPDDNPWAQRVDTLPVHPNSEGYMAYLDGLGGNQFLHADFGENPDYGIPWVVVPPGQPRVPVSFDYADESDPGPYPIPSDAPVEVGSDAHVLVVQDDDCVLYELFAAERQGAGWHAGSGAVFDLGSNALRPDGWTSADAAGLPIFAGLARYDEVQSGAVEHALRVTFSRTQRAYIHPATHYASSITDTDAPPMGLRLRLRADYDISGFTGDARVLLEAMRDYGLIVADNGSNWYVSGATDSRWDDEDLNQLKDVPGGAFEVVDTGPIASQ
ncbi:MAG: hypothetical protein M0R75_11115 [Dehalococcoidia bacterium]|nr:hypothetical protein [Dehalococcoidia bacterium]